MRIVADENIPAVAEAFAGFGEINTLPGRQITPADVAQADILLVRSVTRVNQALLAGSRVRFVGSATIGTDHVDLDWLQANGITFANAPGSNATSAAEYVISALLVLAEQAGEGLAGKTAGIVGCGNVGSRVRTRLQALGVSCLVCDPPLAERTGEAGFVGLDEVAKADIVTLHVPLVTTGPYPTRDMIDAGFLARMKPDAILVNTARGDVIDEPALLRHAQAHDELRLVLDVWQHEPAIDLALLQRANIATPHIAGYSIDGKLRATQMLYDAICDYLGKTGSWRAEAQLPPPAQPVIELDTAADQAGQLRRAMLHVYDVREDDARMRQIESMDANARKTAFDRLRKQYPARRECAAYRLAYRGDGELAEAGLQALGLVPDQAGF